MPTTFVVSLLANRSYMLDTHLIRPPTGVGLPQGSAMSPKLFACVAQRAANAARTAGAERVDTYLDNLYIVDADPEVVERATAAAIGQWREDGLALGDHFTLNNEGCSS